MTRFEERALGGTRTAGPAGGRLNSAERFPGGAGILSCDDHRLEFALDDLVETLIAVLRRHPHIGNVINHICDGRWGDIDQVLRTILDPRSTCNDMSPLAENILELLWAERGTTGRILKPRFCSLLNKLLPVDHAAQLCAHVSSLSLEMESLRYAPRRQCADDACERATITIAGGGEG